MHRSLLILLFSALLITAGCGGGPSQADKAPRVRTATMSEDQALDKARQAVQDRDSFASTAEYVIKPSGNDRWQIEVNSSGGEFRLIVLDDLGDVVRYEGG